MIYLDTNIWLKFINAKRTGKCFPKTNEGIGLLANLEKNKYEVIFSFYNFIELSDRLRDQKINLRLLGEGYSVFDLNRERKQTEMLLTEEEQTSFDEEIELITSLKFVESEIDKKPRKISQKEMGEIYELIGYGINIEDALHVIFAKQASCSIFITDDRPFYKGLKKTKSSLLFLKNLEILNSKEALGNLNVKK
ncbi:MAG: hypothetical protein ABIE14_02835 [Patescibacteria group bacterium]